MGVSPGNIIGDLKDRFGFGGNSSKGRYDEEEYYDDYDDYGYEDDGSYAESYYDSQADPYDRLEYTTRTTAGRPSRSSYTSPHLVSSQDIRATTSAYGVTSSAAGSSAGSFASTSGQGTHSASSVQGRANDAAVANDYDIPVTSYTDFVSPYQEAAQHKGAQAGASGTSTHSAGLDSLFTPSASGASASQKTSVLSNDASSNAAYYANAATQAAPAPASLTREITLLQPVTYEDVANVARAVKRGNIVVLSLRSTDGALSKRVLDFSFGVASALDARVDCVADKTFVIVQGKDLTNEERQHLQKQGIL